MHRELTNKHNGQGDPISNLEMRPKGNNKCTSKLLQGDDVCFY